MDYIKKQRTTMTTDYVHEAFNKQRRIINLFRRELNMTRKAFKRKIKRIKEFRSELIKVALKFGMEENEIRLLGINPNEVYEHGQKEKE